MCCLLEKKKRLCVWRKCHNPSTQMLSLVLKNRIGAQAIRRVGSYSTSRFFSTKPDVDTSKGSAKESDGKEEKKVAEKTSVKKDVELPDFPEYPHIRADYESGIRNRDYLKTIPKEKRMDLLSKKPGEIVYFDDEEFKYYFPHE